MAYPVPSNIRDAADTTAAVKFRQAVFSAGVKDISPDTFGGRLLIAAKTTKKGDIARIFGVGGSSVTNYMRAETAEGSYPEIDKLIKFAAETKCDLHWLLTGKGKEAKGELDFLGDNERQIVETISRTEKKKVEQVLRELVLEALAGRAAELFTHLNRTGRITDGEREQLVVLYDLVSTKSSKTA